MIQQLLWTEMVVAVFGLIVLILLLIWLLLKEIVYGLQITVTTDKTEYPKGDVVTISGTLATSTGNPLPNKSIALAIQPPSGDAYSLPSVTTDADGNFSAQWTVPEDTVLGEHTVTATHSGASATATFTIEKKP